MNILFACFPVVVYSCFFSFSYDISFGAGHVYIKMLKIRRNMFLSILLFLSYGYFTFCLLYLYVYYLFFCMSVFFS